MLSCEYSVFVTLFTLAYPFPFFLFPSTSLPFHFPFAPHTRVTSPLIFSFHFTSLTSFCHPCYSLILSSVCLHSEPSSLISSVFLSVVTLLSLPLLSFLSHLIPLRTHPFIHFPFCHFSYFTDCLSEAVLTKQCTKCHFQKPRATVSSVKTTLSSHWYDSN